MRQPLRQDAGNLLARIHRDGGHHTEKVGFKQSCLDAEQEWIALRAEVERLRSGAVIRASLDAVVLAERRREKAEAALREIEQATRDIPEQNCAIVNQIARAALRDTAPEEPREEPR